MKDFVLQLFCPCLLILSCTSLCFAVLLLNSRWYILLAICCMQKNMIFQIVFHMFDLFWYYMILLLCLLITSLCVLTVS